MSFYKNYYVYYGGACITNKRIQVNSIDFRSSSATILDKLDDDAVEGVKVVKSRNANIELSLTGSLTYTSKTINDELDVMSDELAGIFKYNNTTLNIINKKGTQILWDGTNTTGWVPTMAIPETPGFPILGINTVDFQTNNSSITNEYFQKIEITGFTPFSITGWTGIDIPFLKGGNSNCSISYIQLADANGTRLYDIDDGVTTKNKGFKRFLLSKEKTEFSTGTPPTTVDKIILYFDANKDSILYLGESYLFKSRWTKIYKNVYSDSRVNIDYDESIQNLASYWSVEVMSEKSYTYQAGAEIQEETVSSTTNPVTFDVNPVSTTLGLSVAGNLPIKPLLIFGFFNIEEMNVAFVTAIKIENPITGGIIEMSINSFIIGKTVKVDFENKLVTLDNVPIYFVGGFDDFFEVGFNQLKVTFTADNIYTATLLIEKTQLNY